MFLEEVVKMYFIVVDGVLVDIVIGLTDLGHFQAHLDL